MTKRIKECSMPSSLYKFSALLLLLLLQACASNVRTTITSFAVDEAPLPVGSIRVLPGGTPDAKADLEFQFYAKELQQKFKNSGFTVAEKDEAADYDVQLSYAVQRQEREKRGSRSFVHTGFGFYGSRFGSTVVVDPRDAEFEYVRLVEIHIVKRGGTVEDALRAVKAVSAGSCEYLISVFPSMLDAIFKNLHRSSGSVVTVASPSGKPCSVRE